MIEVMAARIRWLVLASTMILIGGFVFLAIARRARTTCDAPWLARLERALPWRWLRFCWDCWACLPRPGHRRCCTCLANGGLAGASCGMHV